MYAMDKEEGRHICNTIIGFSPSIRFVGIIGETGALLAYARRKDLEPLLDYNSTHYQFSHIAVKTGLEAFFDKNLGKVKFVWEERVGVQIIYFSINKMHIWVSIDNTTVRSQVLRIIDACLPIARKYADKI